MGRKRTRLVLAAVLAMVLGISLAIPALADSGRRGDDSTRDHERDDDREHRDDEDDHDDDDEDDDHRTVKVDVGEHGQEGRHHSWKGRLCNGEDYTIDFYITDDGVEVDEVKGVSAKIDDDEDEAEIEFSDGGRVKIKGERGKDLEIESKRGRRCRGNGGVTTTMVPTPTTAPAPTTAPPAPTTPSTTGPSATTPAPTTPSTTSAPTNPPTSPVSTNPPTTQAPATIPQKTYRTYQTDAGPIVLEWDPNTNQVMFWAITTNWAYWAEIGAKTPGDRVFVHLDDPNAGEASLTATVSGSSLNVSFKNTSGATVTVAPSSESTTAPARSNSSS